MSERARMVRVQLGSGFLNVEYEILGDDAFEQARRDWEEGRELGAIAGFLARVIVGWDLTDDAGRPLPIDEEVMRQLSASVLYAIREAIRFDLESRRPRFPDERRN